MPDKFATCETQTERKNDKINRNTSEKTECNLPFGEINCVHTNYNRTPTKRKTQNAKVHCSVLILLKHIAIDEMSYFFGIVSKGVCAVYAHVCVGSECSRYV